MATKQIVAVYTKLHALSSYLFPNTIINICMFCFTYSMYICYEVSSIIIAILLIKTETYND